MFLLILYVVSILAILSIDITIGMQLTFILNLSLCVYIMYRVISSKIFNPLLVTSTIFFFLFFIIAPLIQLNKGYTSANTYIIKPNIAIYSNILIFLFFFILFYMIRKINILPSIIMNREVIIKFKGNNILLLLISILAIIIANFSGSSNEEEGNVQVLIVKKVILMLPYFCIIMFLSNENIKFRRILPLIILFVLLMISKNPLNERRNALGPIYLTIIYFFLAKYLYSNFRFYIFNFTLFIIFFPLSSLFTHTRGDTIKERIESVEVKNIWEDVIYNHFLQLHYDAWSMINATIEYIGLYGFTFGRQLLGAVLFFFPRKYWEDKPNGSGALVADELFSKYYDMDFNNLASPVIAEGYINFGILGVILFAIILSRIFNWCLKNLTSNRYDFLFLIYISFYLFFFLRGDLMNGISYFAGASIAYISVKKIFLK